MLENLIQGSAHRLPMLEDESVHTIITSPPYYNLRNYHGDQSVEWPAVSYAPIPNAPCAFDIPAMTCALGQEPTVEAYIGHLILCLREWRRVLRADGTCWVNLGDSYNGSGGSGGDYSAGGLREGEPRTKGSKSPGLKAKDLCMVPQRFAMAAQADGWWLRAEVIWSKKSPMPESVTDRPTRAHEQIYLLTKSERYYYDHVAVRRPLKQSSVDRIQQPNFINQTGGEKDYRNGTNANRSMRNTLENFAKAVKFGGTKADGYESSRYSGNEWVSNGGANLRDVLHIGSTPFKGSHYATMPEHIPDIAIKAGTSAKGCCPACGAPWRRVAVKTDEIESHKNSRFDKGKTGKNGAGRTQQGERYKTVTTGREPTCACCKERPAQPQDHLPAGGQRASGKRGNRTANVGQYTESTETTGWESTCECEPLEPIPCTVLDPFGGSGTTSRVATRLGRRSVYVDISADYLAELVPGRLAGLQMEMCF